LAERLSFHATLANSDKKMAAKKKRRWSQRVTATSNALDLDKGVFSLTDPRGIARAKTFRRPKPSPENRPISIGHVDAELLHQSRRPQAFEESARAASSRQG
jgi:Protein of unknown function (DUF3175)